MRRREFIAGFGGAVAWPLATRAQQPAMPVIGYVGTGDAAGGRLSVGGLHRGLMELGFVERGNIIVEYRWAEDRQERLPELAADLVRRGVAVICTPSNVATLAAKAATSHIPIVFVVGLDPVLMGIVSAIDRPGGNATGVFFPTSALEPKRLELVRELLPGISVVAALVNLDNPNAESHTKDLKAAASKLALRMRILPARNLADIDTAFAILVEEQIGALLVTSDPLFNAHRQRLVELAARNAIPTVYPWRDFADAGGLVSYGNSLTDAVQQVGIYAGRILKGSKPGELPVWLPTKFEFVLNLRTAKALGVTVPLALQASADEVIE